MVPAPKELSCQISESRMDNKIISYISQKTRSYFRYVYEFFKKIFRTRARTCQKSLTRMEPVSLTRKPEKVSKIRKHPDKGLSMVATDPTEKKKEIMGGPQTHLLH